MIPVWLLAITSLLYFGLLFGVAYYADQRRAAGRSLISNAHTYSLSLAVYATSWTFYGSVGRAATSGLDFLPVYLGPTLIAFSWWFLLRKMVRVSKEQNLVSIADFISSRYGKSATLGAVVTVFAVLGIMPYIALQLKAVAHTFDLLSNPLAGPGKSLHQLPNLGFRFDTALVVALILALFGVLFGARNLDASERHEGLVAAIALESLVKIVAFVGVGIFVTFVMFDGFGDIFTDFMSRFPDRQDLLLINSGDNSYAHWVSLTFISMMAVMFLPRQFHIMVIENSDEEHIKSAMWRFPAYMFLMNLFVIPIALAGLLMYNGDTQGADYFVLTLPLQFGQPWLALLVFIGGFSASAGMVMVSSVALATMVLNHLVMPLIIRMKIEAADISGLLIIIKRLAIIAVIFLGYLYYWLLGESYALVNIGLISFMAATQFAPGLIGGLYWRHATRGGALTGLILGFILWFYTLLVPSFVRSGWLDHSILDQGLFGISFLRPLELFGLTGFDIWTHALFWTLLFNVGAFLAISLLSATSRAEAEQAIKFVDVFVPQRAPLQRERISKAPSVMEFVELMTKFIGEKQAHTAISQYLGNREIDERGSLSEYELPNLKRFTERTLAGSVGAAPARIIIENYLATRGSRMEDVFDIFGSVTLSRTSSREQLGVLYESARLVASGANLQSILDDILQLLQQQFKFDLGVIRILDDDRNTLVVQSQVGMSSEHLGESERDLNMETYIGATYLTNSTTVVNDTDFMDKAFSAVIIHREGIKSFAHTPIVIEGQPIGVLSAFSRTSKGMLTEEFIALFENLAGLIGVAWRNARQTAGLIAAREQERELQIAKNIQVSLLPDHTPDFPGIKLAGICVPASQVGGDYYDFLPRTDGRIDLVIADVSGHNVGAALIMAETRTFIHARTTDFGEVHRVMEELNEFFYADLTRAELFITMFYCSFHPETHRLTYASAGHNRPLLWRSSRGACDRLDAEGMIFGIKRQIVFEEEATDLAPGDILFLYTDGVTEAMHPDSGELFGEERLCELLAGLKDLPPEGIIEEVLRQVRTFTGLHSFQDDVSLIVMKVE
ncbi:SpoIIE family protein phosphatase [Desulfuromonas carbonis]|uniref:SpoIIE family protein phosphatase n=1 Tax=Desulfuromonas sp. DDH964 TaxID=1823759 RepID=UPI00078B1D70|nr:SpoIIE family protein phosphatase [Desulfuromonas sp. DDH964]AMV72494.1 stage II sporulation protein [Desulfuromonas sp. DDH964]